MNCTKPSLDLGFPTSDGPTARLVAQRIIDTLYESMHTPSLSIMQTTGKLDVGTLLEDMLLLTESHGIHANLLLGPTDPLDSPVFKKHRIGWLTWETEISGRESPSLTLIDPSDLFALRVYISGIVTENDGRATFLGDFLDTTFSSISSNERLFAFMSQIASRMKAHEASGAFVISEELHDKQKLAIAHRVADRVIKIKALDGKEERSNLSHSPRLRISSSLTGTRRERAFALP